MPEKGVSLLSLDLNALTQPLSKLIDTVSSAVGVVYEPTRIRRRARAESDATIIKTKGDIEARELAARASHRLETLELRRQRNIEAIVAKAAAQLPHNVKPDPVDEDWVARFFSTTQDVGDEEMQLIWARLLAGEVASPGSFSPRTIDLVRLLTAEDARLFKAFSNYIWLINGEPANLVDASTDTILDRNGLPYSALLHLETLGLISMPPTLILLLEKSPITTAVYFQHRYSSKEPVGTGSMHVRILTAVGREILPLCDRQPDQEYHAASLQYLRTKDRNLQEASPEYQLSSRADG